MTHVQGLDVPSAALPLPEQQNIFSCLAELLAYCKNAVKPAKSVRLSKMATLHGYGDGCAQWRPMLFTKGQCRLIFQTACALQAAYEGGKH